MKKIIFAFMLSGAFVTFNSCTGIMPDTLNFNLDIPQQEFIVTPNPLVGEQMVDPKVLSVNLDSAVAANSDNVYELAAVRFAKITLSTKDDSKNFDAFKSANFLMSHPELGDQYPAHIEDVPTGISSVELNTENTNLAEYLKKPTFSIGGKVITDEPINDTLKVNVNMTFKIELKKK